MSKVDSQLSIIISPETPGPTIIPPGTPGPAIVVDIGPGMMTLVVPPGGLGMGELTLELPTEFVWMNAVLNLPE
jgi:hypothetical protein